MQYAHYSFIDVTSNQLHMANPVIFYLNLFVVIL